MTQLQQIISRIQSGELTRENDIVGKDGFYDFITSDFFADETLFINTLWDLYETMDKQCFMEKNGLGDADMINDNDLVPTGLNGVVMKRPVAEIKKEYRWSTLTGELLGTFYCDAPMALYNTNVKPIKVTVTTTEKMKLEELEERVERLEKAVGIEHFYATNQ